MLVLRVRQQHRAGAEEQRPAPAREQRYVGGEREDVGLEAGDGVQADRRDLEHVLDRDALAQWRQALDDVRPGPTVRNRTSASAEGEITFGATPPEIRPTE